MKYFQIIIWLVLLTAFSFIFYGCKDDEGAEKNTFHEVYELEVEAVYRYNNDDIEEGDIAGTLTIRELKNDPEFAYEAKLDLNPNINAVDYGMYDWAISAPRKQFGEYHKIWKLEENRPIEPGELQPRVLLGHNQINANTTVSMVMVLKLLAN